MEDQKKTPVEIFLSINAESITWFFYNTLAERAKIECGNYEHSNPCPVYRKIIDTHMVYINKYPEKFIAGYYTVFIERYKHYQGKMRLPPIYIFSDFIKEISKCLLPPQMESISLDKKEKVVCASLLKIYSNAAMLFKEMTEDQFRHRSNADITKLHALVDGMFSVEHTRLANTYRNPHSAIARDADIEALRTQLNKVTSELEQYKANSKGYDALKIQFAERESKMQAVINELQSKITKYDKMLRVLLQRMQSTPVISEPPAPLPEPVPEPPMLEEISPMRQLPPAAPRLRRQPTPDGEFDRPPVLKLHGHPAAGEEIDLSGSDIPEELQSIAVESEGEEESEGEAIVRE